MSDAVRFRSLEGWISSSSASSMSSADLLSFGVFLRFARSRANFSRSVFCPSWIAPYSACSRHASCRSLMFSDLSSLTISHIMGIDLVLGMGPIGAFSIASASLSIILTTLLILPCSVTSCSRTSLAHGSRSGTSSPCSRRDIMNGLK